MTPFVVGIVLLAALFHATWNAVVKSGADSLLTQTFVIGVAALVGLAAIPFLPIPTAASWPWPLASVAIHQLYFLALTASYEQGDFSQVYPIARGSAPLLVAAVAPFLIGETLGFVGSLGIAVISLGILSLAWSPGLFRRRPEKPILFALMTALTIMGYSLVDARGVRFVAAADGNAGVFGYIAWFFFLCGPVLAAIVLPRRRAGLSDFMRLDRGDAASVAASSHAVPMGWFCGPSAWARSRRSRRYAKRRSSLPRSLVPFCFAKPSVSAEFSRPSPWRLGSCCLIPAVRLRAIQVWTNPFYEFGDFCEFALYQSVRS